MLIQFDNLLPHPLKEYEHSADSVWERTFEIDASQKILLNASSGKGKSTFVNTLYGIRHDYTGTAKFDGKSIESFTLSDWQKLRVNKLSMIFQDLQLFLNISVIDNLKLKNNLTNHKTEAEILTMLKTLGIDDKANQLCGHLSYGQQQRVAIIRSLLQPFDLLLMDEPFSHLDEGNTQIALQLLTEETNKNNAGFILSTLGSDHGYNFDFELKL
jgi:ABC-type lipoprotein export system ATPase subunit